MTSLLYQRNLSQYIVTTLASVHYQFIIKLKFDLKQRLKPNVINNIIDKENSENPNNKQNKKWADLVNG